MNRQRLIVADFLIHSGIFLEIAPGPPSIVIGSFDCLSNISLMENH
jgi:hypothetical protein